MSIICKALNQKIFIQKNNISGVKVSTAGTEAGNYDLTQELKLFKKLGIDYSNHKQRKVSEEIIKNNDLIITMDKFNQRFIKKKFGTNSILFNQFCYGKRKGIINFQSMIKEEEIILYIKDSIPFFFESLKNYIKKTSDFSHS
ncbi:MAG: hypothetical protein KAS04_06955 [Candidatus Aenigmarchaeota archaeon]|nr:hypothetical protein [Candidatus Aenigmarchaeota archaeon]